MTPGSFGTCLGSGLTFDIASIGTIGTEIVGTNDKNMCPKRSMDWVKREPGERNSPAGIVCSIGRSSLKRLNYVLLGVFALCCATTKAQDWQRELEQLSDNGFIGALSRTDVALATAIATQVGSQLSGTDHRCGQPNPFAGTLIGNINSDKLSSPEPLLADASPTLLPLLTRLDKGTHRQDAVILYSLSLIGPKAESSAPYLDWLFNRDEPWAATALDAIICEKHQAPHFSAFSEQLPRDFAASLQACGADFPVQLLRYAIEPDLLWPNSIFSETLASSLSGCRAQQSPSNIPPDLMPSVVHFLLNAGVSSTRKLEVMGILEEKFSPHLAALNPALQQMLTSKDEDIRFAAERLTVMRGTEQSAQIWRQWLIDGYNSYLWNDYLHYVSKHRSIVMPALLQLLESPYWSQRTAATEAIASLGSEEAISNLSEAVADFDWVQTEAVIDALKPYAASHTHAAATLKTIAESYWSPRVRQRAAMALNPSLSAGPDDEEVDRIEIIGIADVDHGLPTCVREKTPLYEFPNEEKHPIQWNEPARKPLPRGEFSDISSWCGTIGSFVVHELSDGWLAGCLGFESSGGLAFLPKDRNKPIRSIAHISTTGIVEFNDAIYVTGWGLFGSGKEDAGQLFRLTRYKDEWKVEPHMLLPSITQAAAVIDGYMVFDDAHSTVAVDADRKIYPLSCPMGSRATAPD